MEEKKYFSASEILVIVMVFLTVLSIVLLINSADAQEATSTEAIPDYVLDPELLLSEKEIIYKRELQIDQINMLLSKYAQLYDSCH